MCLERRENYKKIDSGQLDQRFFFCFESERKLMMMKNFDGERKKKNFFIFFFETEKQTKINH